VTTEEIIISIVRIIGALLVLRWAFFGSIFAVLIDFSDLFLMNLLNLGGVGDYQALDKVLDLAYMTTFLYVSLRWNYPSSRISLFLFLYRIIGLIVFEWTGLRWVLLIFPNVFEVWFIFGAAIRRYHKNYGLRNQTMWFPLLLLFFVKEIQEFVLHGTRWLDRYRAIDVVQDLWEWSNRGF
jgi:hypothetical protein